MPQHSGKKQGVMYVHNSSAGEAEPGRTLGFAGELQDNKTPYFPKQSGQRLANDA